jgi:formylglycine-generating enzyme required for sulfatase activity
MIVNEDPSPQSSTAKIAISDLPVLVAVPAGWFWLGASPGDSLALEVEMPGREVYLGEFAIGRYPVTNKQYAHFVKATGHPMPVHWVNDQIPLGLEDHPVVQVNSIDAYEYCCWLSQLRGQTYRLPTEAEWEKAARGALPDKRRYVWGDEWHDKVCNTQELGTKQTTSALEFETVNRSPFGVVDLLGNTWEWTATWYEPHPGSSHESPNYGHTYYILHGGSWKDRADNARISCRGRCRPDIRRGDLGFRVLFESIVQPEIAQYTEMPNDSPQAGSDASMANKMQQNKIDRSKLHDILAKRFDLDEFRLFCWQMGIDYESLSGENKISKARELISYCERRDSLAELVDHIQRQRPDIKW